MQIQNHHQSFFKEGETVENHSEPHWYQISLRSPRTGVLCITINNYKSVGYLIFENHSLSQNCLGLSSTQHFRGASIVRMPSFVSSASTVKGSTLSGSG